MGMRSNLRSNLRTTPRRIHIPSKRMDMANLGPNMAIRRMPRILNRILPRNFIPNYPLQTSHAFKEIDWESGIEESGYD
jgi:hypothetical protein